MSSVVFVSSHAHARPHAPGVPTLHTSATVTNMVLADILGVFELPPSVLISRVDFSQRETLKYEVVKVTSAAEKFIKICSIIRRVVERRVAWDDSHLEEVLPPTLTGNFDFKFPVAKKPAVVLIFVRTRHQAERLVEQLLEAQPSVISTAFHSKLQPGQKAQAIAMANAALLDVLVSTSALECGQDIGTVAETVQADQAFSLSSSAQGFGRAGRSSAFSLNTPGIATHVYHRVKLLNSLGPMALTRHGKAEFLKQLYYLENTRQCRLGIFCKHFGGSPPARCRGLCDVCCDEGPEKWTVLRLDEWAYIFCSSWTGVLAVYQRRYPRAIASLRQILKFMREERSAEWLAHSLNEDKATCVIHNLLIHGALDVKVTEREAVRIEDPDHPAGWRLVPRSALVELQVGHPNLLEQAHEADPPIEFWVW